MYQIVAHNHVEVDHETRLTCVCFDNRTFYKSPFPQTGPLFILSSVLIKMVLFFTSKGMYSPWGPVLVNIQGLINSCKPFRYYIHVCPLHRSPSPNKFGWPHRGKDKVESMWSSSRTPVGDGGNMRELEADGRWGIIEIWITDWYLVSRRVSPYSHRNPSPYLYKDAGIFVHCILSQTALYDCDRPKTDKLTTTVNYPRHTSTSVNQTHNLMENGNHCLKLWSMMPLSWLKLIVLKVCPSLSHLSSSLYKRERVNADCR